jgi:hypothetical protein
VNSGRTVFSQLIQHLPEREFQKCVARYNSDSNLRGFSRWDQLLAMAFAQLTYRESLRDIESCLRALQSKRFTWGSAASVAPDTRCQRITRLENLCGVRSSIDRHCPVAACA